MNGRCRSGSPAAFCGRRPLQLLQRAVDVGARVRRVVALPHRDRRAEVPVAGDRPVTGARDPLAELAVLDVLRHPVDLLVELAHPVPELRDADEPAGHRLIDQRVAAAPAVRVGVLVARLTEQPALVLQELRQRLVRVEHLQALDIADGREEARAVVDGDDHRDAGGLADALVVLAVGRSLVHDAGAVLGADVVVHEDAPRVLRAVGLGVRVVVPQTVVVHVLQVAAEHGARDGGLRVRGGLVAEVLRVVAEQVGGDEVLAAQHVVLGTAVRVGGTVRAGGHDRVGDLRADREGQVGRQGPRRRRPGERAHAGQPERLGLRPDQREGDRDRLVLTHLVDVVVHPELVVRQRRLVAPAVGQHAVALVGEALPVQLLERPDHRLHVGDVERLVVVVEVDPARLTGDVLLPLLRVAQHGLLGRLVEGGDAHLLDLALVGQAELPLRLELGREAVGVPAEAAVHLLAAHGLEAREDVLGVAGQQVTVVREAVGERRPVVEHPLGRALAVRDGGAERVVLLPEREDAGLDLGEGRAGRDIGAVLGVRALGLGSVRCGLGVRHLTPGRFAGLHEDAGRVNARRGTTPLAPSAGVAGCGLSFFGCDGPAPFGSTGRRRSDAVLPKTRR